MKDKSKKLLVINTNKKPSSAQSSAQSSGGTPYGRGFGGVAFDMSDYLLKAVWDRVFELKADISGAEYLFTKLPLATQYGITMYANGEDMNIPSIYDGLPIDGKTLFRDENGVLMVNPDIEFGGGGLDEEKLKAFLSSENYAKKSDIPSLNGYATESWVTGKDYVNTDTLSSELAKYVPINGDTDILGLKNFTKGLLIDGLSITKSQDDVIYLDANLVVRGGITMYAEGEVNIPSIIDSLPIASTTAKGIASFDGTYFAVDSNGKVTLLAANVGLNEEELAAYLTEKEYATQSWVYSLGYASSSDLNALQTKVNDFLEGGDTDAIINKWKELEVFLSGLSESDNLATILGTKWTTDNDLISQWNTAYGWGDHSKVGYALKSYVDDTFVTLASRQDITGEKNFKGGLKVNGSPIVYDSTNKYWKLEGDLLVTGGISMFSSDSAFVPSTIMDAIATDNVNLKVVDGVLTFVGSSGGGLTEVYWDDVIGRPTLLSSFIDDVGYLQKSGGEINGSLHISNGSLALLGAKNSGASTISFESNGNSYSSIMVSRYGIDYNGILSILPKGGMIGVGLTNPEYKFHVLGDIFSSGMVIANNGIDSRGASSYGSLPYIRLHIPGLTYAQFLLNSNGAIELRFGDSTQTGGFVDFYSGNIVSSGGITMYSDIRKKTKLQDVELTLQQIADAPLIEHYYNSDSNKTTHVGSIAQYWASMNDWFCKLDNEGYYTMEIQNAALASAISIARELQRYESKTDKKIRLLKKRIGELEDEIEKLKMA